MSAAGVASAPLVRRRPPAAVRRRRVLVSVANHSLLIVVAAMFLAPFVFIVLTSLMTNTQALSSDLWPHPFRWSNFVDVFRQAPIWRWALNTLMYSGLATLGLLISSIPVAYALSRLRWRGRDAVFVVVLIALMLPPQVSVVPIYVMWAKLGNFLGFHFIGTLWPLIIPNWLGDAFSIFLLRQFFLTIPEEYFDAARLEGGAWVRFRHVILPLSRNATFAVILLSFIGGLRTFDLIWTMTHGGPGFASDVLTSVIYKEYQAGFYGLSTAGNVVLFVLVTIIVYPLMRFFNRRELDL